MLAPGSSHHVLVLVVLGLVAVACEGNDFTDTPPKNSTGGSGGTSGTGGTAGDAGSSGSGGTIGDAGDEDVSTGGTGGTAGEGGSAGADAGDASDDLTDATEEPEAFWCDPTWEPGDHECVIDDEFGVFVSPSGSDGAGCGTEANPCATMARGMTEAKAAGKRVYACGDGGAYAENLVIDASLDGLVVFGGFHCSGWTYEPDFVKTNVAPASGSALVVENLTTGLDMRDFALTSADATTPGSSSVAAVVRNAQNVVLRRCEIQAGAGASGVAGQPGTEGGDGAVADIGQLGKPASCVTVPSVQQGGEWTDPSSCGSQGGFGGPAVKNNNGSNGDQGIPATNVTPPNVDNRGIGGTVVGEEGGAGGPGSSGNAGSNGLAAPATGQLSSSGYTPADGLAGSDGRTGQGGGGGGASRSAANCIGASGGAGGMGGCGGTHGTGGTGGGASVAMLVWDSVLTLDDCTLTSATGGAGGSGGPGGGGGLGQDGGDGGNSGGGMGRGGKGGKGGSGGLGGSGSGGTGGPSYALVYHGAAPTEQGATTLAPGSGGTKGVGGQAPGGNAAPDGADGETAQRKQVQ